MVVLLFWCAVLHYARRFGVSQGDFIRGGVSPHLKEESGVGKRWRPWGLSLVLSGGSLGLLPFPAVSIAAGGLWRSLLQRRASFCSPEVRLNRVSGAWMYENMTGA